MGIPGRSRGRRARRAEIRERGNPPSRGLVVGGIVDPSGNPPRCRGHLVAVGLHPPSLANADAGWICGGRRRRLPSGGRPGEGRSTRGDGWMDLWREEEAGRRAGGRGGGWTDLWPEGGGEPEMWATEAAFTQLGSWREEDEQEARATPLLPSVERGFFADSGDFFRRIRTRLRRTSHLGPHRITQDKETAQAQPSQLSSGGSSSSCDGEASMASLSLSLHHPCNSKKGFLGKRQGICPRVIPAGRVGFVRKTIECKESRIGKKPIEVPSNVTLTLEEQFIKVKGPLGELSLNYPGEVNVVKEESGKLRVSKTVETKRANQMHGLFRTLTDNIIVGVSKGFDKKLQLVGVGYRAAVEGKDLVMNLGFSHPVRMAVPEGLKVKVEENTRIIVSGYDKSEIGQFAASIKKWRPPEPYKGKGIRYADEVVRRKEGKAGKKK
uniref:Large ribosomal subunit protein uL6c n=3 Tax=Oryza TaxID=4527 RepID=A0A0E0KJ38_ORYPU